MKFATRSTVRVVGVCAAITLIIGLGFVWKVSPFAGIVANDNGRQPVDSQQLARQSAGQQQGGPGRDNRGTGGFDFGTISDFIQTFVILGGVLSAVVVFDKCRGNPRVPVDLRTAKRR